MGLRNVTVFSLIFLRTKVFTITIFILGVITALTWKSIAYLVDQRSAFCERQQQTERASKRRHQIRSYEGPWARLWWETLDACRLWYRSTASSASKRNASHPEWQRYHQALRYLRRQYVDSYDWYNPVSFGDDLPIQASFFWGTMTFSTTFVWVGVVSRTMRIPLLSHVSSTFPDIPSRWAPYLLALIIGLWIYQLRHMAVLWWMAGPPWWESSRRVQRLLHAVSTRRGIHSQNACDSRHLSHEPRD